MSAIHLAAARGLARSSRIAFSARRLSMARVYGSSFVFWEPSPAARPCAGPRPHRPAHDPRGQRAIGMVEGQGAEVLILHGDQPAGPGDPDHFPEDGGGVRDMEEDGHREDTVEAVGGEAEPRAVAHGMDEARSEAARAREPPRRLG